MPSFRDIPKLTSQGSYQINVPWMYLEKTIQEYLDIGLELNPDFQRGHVWTEAQQIAYVEFILRGGKTARTIYFNNPSWGCQTNKNYTSFVCVDGLQRLTAVRRFLNNEIPAFGHYLNEYTDRLPLFVDFIFNVNDLQTKREVLVWYIEMNSAGTEHTSDEINRVKKLLEEEK